MPPASLESAELARSADVVSLRNALRPYRMPIVLICVGAALSVVSFVVGLNGNMKRSEREFSVYSENQYLRLYGYINKKGEKADVHAFFSEETTRFNDAYPLSVRVYDNAHNGKIIYGQELGDADIKAGEATGLHYEKRLSLRGRDWRVSFVPAPIYFSHAITWHIWTILGFGLILTGAAGTLVFSLVARNVSAQGQMDEQSRKLSEMSQNILTGEEKIRAILDNTVDGMITIDDKGKIESFNKACEKIFGYAAKEVLGRNVNMLMPEPYHDEHDQYLKNYASTGNKKIIGVGREVAGKRKDGSVFPLDLSVAEVKIGKGRVFSGIVRDISERKRVEAEREIFVRDLERSNKELDDFAYIASHDMKEPLRGLYNNARFLLEDYAEKLDADGKNMLERINYLSQRMEKLVNDLLYFSRIGRQNLAIQKTDLNEVMEDIKKLMEDSLIEQNATILVPEKLPVVTCDKPRITEAFRNLIANAVKYNDKSEKTVEIGYLTRFPNRHGKMLYGVFYVKDNGIGIKEEFYDDIFRIFKRLNEEDDTKKGTGAGLTFVKKIIERHNGQIWPASEFGKSTTFYFTIA
ncbi:MAG: PAS domain S-box protein [Rickettsiales bacterium]